MTSTRILAAVLGLAVILPAMFFGGVLAVQIIVGLALVVAADEWARMAFPDDHRFAFAWLLSGLTALVLAETLGTPDMLTATSGLVVVGTLAMVALRPGPALSDGAARAGWYMVGFSWLSLLWFLVRLREFDQGVWFVLLALLISWLGDTGAYFAGRTFGKHKLAPRISPKKTVEGLVGGVLAAAVGVVVLKWLVLTQLSWLDAVLLGAVGCLVGVVGDLAESLFKRAFDVKDSGWILPGHGGILDRVDSVLFVAPTVWAYMVIVHAA